MSCHVVVEENAGQDRDRDNGSIRDLHERGHQSGEAKSLDDDGAKVADTSVGNVAYHTQ